MVLGEGETLYPFVKCNCAELNRKNVCWGRKELVAESVHVVKW